MLIFHAVRIKVAAFGDNLRQQKPHGWRSVIIGRPGIIPLTHVEVTGTITAYNHKWEFNKKPDEYGIIAYVEYYADVEITAGDIAKITLL